MGIVQHSVGYGWIWISLNRFPLNISWLLCIQNQCGLLMVDLLHCTTRTAVYVDRTSSIHKTQSLLVSTIFYVHLLFLFTIFIHMLPLFYHIFFIFLVIISRMISPCWSSGLRDDFVHLHWHQCRKRPLLAPLRWGFRRSGWRAAGAYWDLLALLLGDYMDYIMNHFQKKDLHNIGNRIYLFLFFLGWLYT